LHDGCFILFPAHDRHFISILFCHSQPKTHFIAFSSLGEQFRFSCFIKVYLNKAAIIVYNKRNVYYGKGEAPC